MGQAAQQVNITYETLFDILRLEKGRDDIQELSENFFADVVAYMRQKKELLEKREHEAGIEEFDDVKKIQIQYENIQRIIKEIYERREKKILAIALNSSRTNLGVSMHNLLPQERVFVTVVKSVLDTQRTAVMQTILKAKMPIEQTQQRPVTKELMEDVQEMHEEQHEQDTPVVDQTVETIRTVRFLKETEEFIGPELETYGPFVPGATAAVPIIIAQILTENGSAEEL